MTTTAFFDLDYTLLRTSSSLMYVKEIVKQRRAPLWIVGYAGLGYLLKRLSFARAHARLITYIGREGRTKTTSFFETLVTERIVPYITATGRAKIASHKSRGHRVVLISASIEELIKPLAQHLGFGQDYLCTHLEVQNDHYTGELNGLPCYGEGKVHWAREWAVKNDLDFPGTVGYFYSDSSSDLPLLELATQPVAVNPSRKLAKIAKARGWAIERFD